jgi:chemotaxis protein CheX
VDENDIQVLIDGTVHYFRSTVGQTTEVGAPYLVEERKPVVSDFTGVITISGVYQGSVYFTAPRAMLRHILMVNGEERADSDFMADVVGEVANTISGNARRYFGNEFEISVPRVFQSPPAADELQLAERSFVIPITWRQYRASLVVSLIH